MSMTRPDHISESAATPAELTTEEEHMPAPSSSPTRTETDSLGSVEVPADAYWGVHTMRALENFPISKRPISVYPELIVALASVKQAAARANRDVGVLGVEKAGWIDEACQRIIDGEFHEQFVVGVIQGKSTRLDAIALRRLLTRSIIAVLLDWGKCLST